MISKRENGVFEQIRIRIFSRADLYGGANVGHLKIFYSWLVKTVGRDRVGENMGLQNPLIVLHPSTAQQNSFHVFCMGSMTASSVLCIEG